MPFFHDHVTSDTNNPHYHGFLVFCSAQGISSGACVPTMTNIGGGIVPFATTVNGQMLTSVGPIESAANSGLVILVDTGATFIAHLNPGA